MTDDIEIEPLTLEDAYQRFIRIGGYMAPIHEIDWWLDAEIVGDGQEREKINSFRDQLDYERYAAGHDERIAGIHRPVEEKFKAAAVKGEWFARGRRPGETEHVPIDPQAWQWFALNREKNAVTTQRDTFIDLRCWFASDLPIDHPFRLALKQAIEHPSDSRSKTTLAPTRPPGRPSHLGLYKDEMLRRIGARIEESSISKEAKALDLWFRVDHPALKPCAAKTLRNKLAEDYREAREQRDERPKQ